MTGFDIDFTGDAAGAVTAASGGYSTLTWVDGTGGDTSVANADQAFTKIWAPTEADTTERGWESASKVAVASGKIEGSVTWAKHTAEGALSHSATGGECVIVAGARAGTFDWTAIDADVVYSGGDSCFPYGSDSTLGYIAAGAVGLLAAGR